MSFQYVSFLLLFYFTVINALSDKYHPLQTLADLMTLKEHFGSLKGKTLAWVGDGNNVLHDLMIGAIKQGMHVKVATPHNFTPDVDVIRTAETLAKVFLFYQ
jgi:ornithine carbamoyltransferase